MEVGTKQSVTAVNKDAAPGDKAMKTMAGVTYQDLGGPTPDNSKPDDDSNKLSVGSGVADGAHAKNLKSVKGFMKKFEPNKVTGEEVEAKEEEVIAEDETVNKEETVVSQEETVEEEKVEEKVIPELNDDVDIEDDVNALLGGQELSEEFREKAKTIFEAALKSKVIEMREALEAQHEAKLVEEVEAMKGELVERVDSYLEYVADEWVQENTLSIEHGLKTEMTESFLEGMKGLFEEHYVSIPDEKYDVVENMVGKLDDMESKLNEQIEKNIAINKRLAEATADGILSDVSEGLASTQKEKLASLAEGIEFESEESYKEKLETLKESYFKTAPKRSESEDLNESAETPVEVPAGRMSAYLQALQNTAQSN
tara:strand:- start:477 stop:1586 length:1110 start_codon:yes stop_codon:yes gene_type:complete